ncbi:AcrR family transcriptional regulator [Mycolicibacterium sp. 624]
MMSFVRAHSPEQREVRRNAILDTARAMLEEMPVSEVTLNGLSRRACMAKSNVLRYFESREAVLLELSAEALGEWVDALEADLAVGFDRSDPVSSRAVRVATVIADSLAARPVLCDLMSAQASVLEHNISTDTVLTYKRASLANIERLAGMVSTQLPELSGDDARKFTAMAALMATAAWTHCHTAPAVVAAYECDPALQFHKLEFDATLRESLELILAGLLSR